MIKTPIFRFQTAVVLNDHINNLLCAISLKDCEKSYKELFILMHGKLVHFANSILKSNEDAEEVVSDFFIGIWLKRGNLRSLEKPNLYFYVGVKNASINKLRLNQRQHMPPLEQWATKLESVFFNPDELLFSKEFTQKIMACVNELPPKCKVIFKLIKEEGFKYAEVAQLLEISVKTVETQMAIAMRKLKSSLEFKNAFPEIHSIVAAKK